MASLYKAYFDESGTHAGSEAAVVAGFVSNATQWESFSHEWQEVLAGANVEYFRMSEFENSRGQFDDWEKDEKETLLNKLLPIIDAHTFWSIGCIVLRQSFDSLLSEDVKRICGDAYGVATLACLRNLGQIWQKHDAWVDCTMEAGAKGRAALQLLVEEDSKFPGWQNEHRILSLSFQEKRVPPLQAADILAYELYKQSQRQFGSEKRPARYPLKVLGNQKHQWIYLQDKYLTELNDDLNRQIAELNQS